MPDFTSLTKDLQAALDVVVKAKQALAQAESAVAAAASAHNQALQRAQDLHHKFQAEIADVLPTSAAKHLKI